MDNKTLKYTRPMMHGPAVVRLQEMLDMLGFDGGVNDGVYGPATERQVSLFQERYGLKVDGVCGMLTMEFVLDACDKFTGTPVNTELCDRRGLHSHPRLYKCKRQWSDIVGVTLHQTGCKMPSNPAGWDRLNAHVGITQEGIAILVNDPTDFIWHAQGLSSSTIGIEIEGNYYGIDGDERTLWRGGGGPHHLNMKMMAALENVRMWLVEQFKRNGQEWSRIYAHRQSKNSRIGDPGEEIWRSVAVRWAQKCEAPTHSTFFCGTGRPLPNEWFELYQADYFCKAGE